MFQENMLIHVKANSNSGYFDWSNWNNQSANGVVNGHDWYEVDGGRQDYMIISNIVGN